jgi:hypothetical protein
MSASNPDALVPVLLSAADWIESMASQIDGEWGPSSQPYEEWEETVLATKLVDLASELAAFARAYVDSCPVCGVIA